MAQPTAVTTIDDLPEKVLLHILSFLPTLDAIQTTVLFPKCRDLWTSLPSLAFDYALFPPCYTVSDTLQTFVDFVSRTLILCSHCDLSSLRLRFDSTTDHRCHRRQIDSWIRYAVDHNVNSLSVIFYSKYIRQFGDAEDDSVYNFPVLALRNSSVSHLHLDRCNLDLPMNASRMRFETMKSMHFEWIYLTDEMVSDLVSGCLNLERLSLYSCYGLKNLKISSCSLISLTLFQFQLNCDEGSVEICAPNLQSLDIHFLEVGNYVIVESPALVEASVCFIHKRENFGYWSKAVRLLGHVKRLHTQNWWCKFAAAKDLFGGSFLFCNLNYLELETDFSKADLFGFSLLLELSPKLETLILKRDLRIDAEIFDESFSKEFDRMNYTLPSLRQLTMKCYWGSFNELYFLRLVLRSAVILEKVVLEPISMDKVRLIPIVLIGQTQGQGFQVVQGCLSYKLNTTEWTVEHENHEAHDVFGH